ncbi:MAG: SDR family NAD(P)-dependent oxidoreductase [Dehalococcoidia bacterium]|nr:SDR family NAD(P)-dependent oxidoreductase [Dehalococcoidia bacterium]
MVLDKLRLDGKVAIITGGGTGLGKGMALAMAEAGADIVVAGRRLEPIQAVADQVRALGRRALAVPTDVIVSSQVDALVARAIKELGHVDVLVNNAGGGGAGRGKAIWEITDAEWSLGMDTNVTGTFYCSRAVARHMVDRKSGAIINIASGSGMRGQPNSFTYNAAKAGVIMLTKSLAITLADHNIRVHCIVPGYFLHHDPVTAEDWQLVRDRGRFIPVGRTGYASEMGPLAVFLASEASSYMTGDVVCIDGGGLVNGIAPIQLVPTVPL